MGNKSEFKQGQNITVAMFDLISIGLDARLSISYSHIVKEINDDILLVDSTPTQETLEFTKDDLGNWVCSSDNRIIIDDKLGFDLIRSTEATIDCSDCINDFYASVVTKYVLEYFKELNLEIKLDSNFKQEVSKFNNNKLAELISYINTYFNAELMSKNVWVELVEFIGQLMLNKSEYNLSKIAYNPVIKMLNDSKTRIDDKNNWSNHYNQLFLASISSAA